MKKFLTLTLSLVLCLMFLSTSFVSMAADSSELEKKTIFFDMSKYEKGTDITTTELGDYFFTFLPNDSCSIILGDDNVIKLTSYIHFCLYKEYAEELFVNGYEISLQYKAKSQAHITGIFLRCVDSRDYMIVNPVFGEGATTYFDLYELDWYTENGGTTAAKSSIGGSGIRVYQDSTNHKIGVDIKSAESDGIGTASWGVEFDYPEGYVENELNSYKFIDDNKGTLEIYVCDTLICKVLYSGEPDMYPDGLSEECEDLYYKTAKIVDAEGTELLSIENARIACDTPCFGIGQRPEPSAVSNFKDLTITYYEKAKPTAAPTAEPTAEPEVEATEEAAQTTTAPAQATTVPADSGSSSSSSNNTVLAVGLIIGAVIIVLVAVIIVILKKKK